MAGSCTVGHTRQSKNLIMASLYKIKSLDAKKFQKIIVGHDMTRKQCNECRNLVAEAKAKAEEFRGMGEQSLGPPRPVEADTSKKVDSDADLLKTENFG